MPETLLIVRIQISVSPFGIITLLKSEVCYKTQANADISALKGITHHPSL